MEFPPQKLELDFLGKTHTLHKITQTVLLVLLIAVKLLIQHERCNFLWIRLRRVDIMIHATTQKLTRRFLGRIILIKFQMFHGTYCCPGEPHLRQSVTILFHSKGLVK